MFLITLSLGLLLVFLFYVLMTWNFDYWKKRRVPGPKPSLFTGNYPHLYNLKRHAIYDINDIYKKYKNKYDAVGIFGARAPQLLVLSPDLARRVHVSDFKHFHDNEISLIIKEKNDFLFGNNPFALVGEKWKQRRADVTPGMTQSRIKSVYPVTNEVCSKLSDWIQKQIRIGTKDGVEGKDLGLRFTCEMVTDCVLGLNAESFSDKPSPIINHIKNLINQPFTFVIYFIIVSTFPSLRHLISLRFISPAMEKFFVNLMITAIDARKAQMAADEKFQRVDFLDYILQLGKKRNLDNRELTAHTMTFLIDGFETTAAVLSFLLLLLGRNEKEQDRLRQEIKDHLNDKGFIDFDQLNELPFLDACVQETIRIFPPAFMSNKICTEPIELPNKNGDNFTVEKGTTVIVPHFSYMNDEDIFPNPEEFQPDRFVQPDATKMYRDRGVFMGFGDGPRICIGMRFALAQIKAVAVELLTKYDIHVNPKTRKDNLLDPTSFLPVLKGGIWLDFKPRN